MVQPLGYLKETASQTAGPYVHIGLLPRQAGFDVFANNLGGAMLGPKTGGERVSIEGRVIDGSGALVKDALIEIWQANAAGRYNHAADRQPNVARGINIGLSTRMYFADEEEANAADPVLNIIEPASRRKTLVGQR